MADYCSTAEVKAQIEKTGAGADAVIAAIITAASRAIDRACNRPPDYFDAPAAASDKYYIGKGKHWLVIDDCVEISTVYMKDAMTDTTYETLATPTSDYAGDGDWFPASGDHRFPKLNETPYNLLLLDPNGDYAAWTKGDYATRPLYTVRVTAKWGGFASVPADIKEAAIMQSARWWKRLQGAMADSLANVDLGTVTFLQAVDPDVKFILQMGRRIKPAV